MKHLSLLLLISCAAEEPSPISNGERQVTLVYSNNLDGEIEPCG